MAANILHKIGFLILCLTFVLSIPNAKSAHIIGADMSFRCVGSGEYIITLSIYRDCASDGAVFDSQPNGIIGRVSLYGSNGNQYLGMQTLSAPETEFIDIASENPCLVVPPGICVEKGTYEFPINLEVSDQSYFVVYQRCCRNNTITNIFDPGGTGATYFVEITPAAQSLCVDSPTFNEFPPVLICDNLELDFDHSASDNLSGSQLVYSFYTPFQGGGLGGSRPGDNQNDAFGPNGVAPQPAPAPPYQQVQFIPPLYSENQPITGIPPPSINSTTGLITGIPNAIGQYVVGVQVQQFFNGQLLSTIRRDFQFNVTNCEPTVLAATEYDEFIAPNTYVINSCGDSTVNIINRSEGIGIQSYKWEFYLEEDTLIFNSENVSPEFPGIGNYSGILIANPGANLCTDTAILNINVFPFLEADFTFKYDTCSPGPIEFFDQSISGGSEILAWRWEFENLETSNQRDPDFLYETSGIKEVILEVKDDNGCVDQQIKEIPYFPLPELIVLSPSKFEGCAPERIQFNNLTEYVTEDYEVLWDFGDGFFGDRVSPSHIYEEPGVYDISISITSPAGCFASDEFRSLITILEGPEAGFDASPMELNSLNKTVVISDESMGANGWQYNFSDEAILFVRDPTYTFQDTGQQFIEQVVFKANGCTDTFTLWLDVIPVSTFHLPNAFTPDGNGINDTYRGVGITDFFNHFSMTIWSRWGEKVFETNDPGEGWNGRKFNSGEPLAPGVYVCLVEFVDSRGNREVIKEFATLIR